MYLLYFWWELGLSLIHIQMCIRDRIKTYRSRLQIISSQLEEAVVGNYSSLHRRENKSERHPRGMLLEDNKMESAFVLVYLPNFSAESSTRNVHTAESRQCRPPTAVVLTISFSYPRVGHSTNYRFNCVLPIASSGLFRLFAPSYRCLLYTSLYLL